MKKFSFLFILCVAAGKLFAQIGSLQSISPNQAQQNQILTCTITGVGTVFQSSSPPSGIINIYLSGPSAIWGFAGWPTDDEHVDVQFNIPGSAPMGLYNLNVEVFDPLPPYSYTLTLNNAFTVAPPDGYVMGNVYFDTNQNGVKDGGETGIQNQQVAIIPGGGTALTDVNGDYSKGLLNGSYTAQWSLQSNQNYIISSAPSIPFIINNGNSTGNDFGLKNAIVSMAINYAQVGTSVTPIITANGLFTVMPSQVYIRKTVSPFNTFSGANNSIIDLDHLSTTITIPNIFSYVGTYDLFIVLSGVTYKLPAAFSVILFSTGVTGKVYYDANGNGLFDAGEYPLSNEQVQVTPGNLTGFTDNLGNYGIGAANGSYTVQYIPQPYEIITSVSSYNVTVNNNIIPNNDFGVQFLPGVDTLSLTVDHWLLRCNWNHWILCRVKNMGPIPAISRMYFLKDPTMTYFSAVPPADYVSNDTAYWDLGVLNPGQQVTVTPTYSTPGAGTNVDFHVIAAVLDAGSNIIFTNQQDFNVTVSCSYDPNDKRVNPPGVQVPNYTLFSEDLYYTVRFQNTGNDTAFNVFIYDTLDANLDFSTFDFISSTHPVNIQLNPANGALKFSFNNILLPDSNVNEPGSNGEFTYRIRTLSGLPANTVVNNTAYIVFDLNTPVVTNTTLNTMVYTIPVGLDEISVQDGLSVYPNPLDESATLHFKNPNQDKFILTISDMEGRTIQLLNTSSNQIVVNKQNMNAGLYLFKLSNVNHTINYYGKFVIR